MAQAVVAAAQAVQAALLTIHLAAQAATAVAEQAAQAVAAQAVAAQAAHLVQVVPVLMLVLVA